MDTTGHREHARLSKILLGQYSLGEGIQKELDAHSQRYPGVHRIIDHDFARLGRIAEKYGSIGELEIAIHIALDWEWFPEWAELAKPKRKTKKET
jgi:hypothetical protein